MEIENQKKTTEVDEEFESLLTGLFCLWVGVGVMSDVIDGDFHEAAIGLEIIGVLIKT